MSWLISGPILDEIMNQMQAEADKQGEEIPVTVDVIQISGTITIGVIGLIMIIWPVFLLIFLGRRSIREEVAGWANDRLPSSDWGGGQ